MNTTVKLLVAAGVLMLLAGCLFAFLKLWRYAALLCAGGLGCLAGAGSFRGREDS